jgi:hypothetical protein
MYFPIDDSVIPYLPARHYAPELFEQGRVPAEPRAFVIDEDHDLAKGLKFLGVVTQGGLYDIVNGALYPLPNATIVSTPEGLVAEYAANTFDAITFRNSWVHEAGNAFNHSVIKVAKLAHSGGAVNSFEFTGSGGTQSFDLNYGWNGVNIRVSWGLKENSASLIQETSDPDAPLGSFQVLSATCFRDDTGNNKNTYGYRAGKFVINTEAVAAFNMTVPGVWDGLSMNSNTGTGKNIQIQYCALWDDLLDRDRTAFHNEIGTNLFQVLKPKGIPERTVKKSTGLWVPERKLEMPSLYEPGVKPTGGTGLEIDWDNPITAGLHICVCPTAQNPNDLAKGKIAAFTDGLAPLSVGAASKGEAYKGFAGQHGAGVIKFPDDGVQTNGDLTMLSVHTVATTQDGKTLTLMAHGETAVNYNMAHDGWSSRRLKLTRKWASSYTVATFIAGDQVTALARHFGPTNDAVVPDWRIKKNGVNIDESVAFSATATMNYGAGVYRVGNSQPDTQEFQGDIYFQCVWTRYLSLDEMNSLRDDPYQFLVPR